MIQFGVDRWICSCGRFYDVDVKFTRACMICHTKRMKLIAGVKLGERLKKGLKIKSWSLRARRGFVTRCVNVGLTDSEKFEQLILNLEQREGNKGRSSFIRKKLQEKINGK